MKEQCNVTLRNALRLGYTRRRLWVTQSITQNASSGGVKPNTPYPEAGFSDNGWSLLLLQQQMLDDRVAFGVSTG